MKKAILLALVALPAAAHAAEIPGWASARPNAYKVLVSVAPECRFPTQATRDACEVSLEMLDATSASEATSIFLQTWGYLAFDRPKPERPQTGHHHHGGDDGIDALVGLVEIIADAAVEEQYRNALARRRGEIAAHTRVGSRTLRAIYAKVDDEYSRAMQPELERLRPESIASFVSFTATDRANVTLAIAEPEGLAPRLAGMSREELDATPPPPMPRPKGKGPVAWRVNGRWKVVEGGQTVKVTTKDGAVVKGVVSAVSTTGLIIATKTQGDVLLLPGDLRRFDVE